MSTATDADAFWRFSTGLYAQPGVAARCLELQDRFGADVNLLLFCLHAGSHGRTLQPRDFATLQRAVAPWREQVVVPLRGVRRWLKTPPASFDDLQAAALRDRLMQVELEAERLQQTIMARVVPATSVDAMPGSPVSMPAAAASATSASAANLARYFATLAPRPGDEALDTLAALLHAAHPEYPASANVALLRDAIATATSSPKDSDA